MTSPPAAPKSPAPPISPARLGTPPRLSSCCRRPPILLIDPISRHARSHAHLTHAGDAQESCIHLLADLRAVLGRASTFGFQLSMLDTLANLGKSADSYRKGLVDPFSGYEPPSHREGQTSFMANAVKLLNKLNETDGARSDLRASRAPRATSASPPSARHAPAPTAQARPSLLSWLAGFMSSASGNTSLAPRVSPTLSTSSPRAFASRTTSRRRRFRSRTSRSKGSLFARSARLIELARALRCRITSPDSPARPTPSSATPSSATVQE